ncbi:MAG: DUF305 domain-containing protein [Caulobacterales bacterium]|nr:DUF305 domain-containing protein [Caulobacterales bacterium]
MGYGRFAAMIATSTVVMFALMYFNTYALEHVRFSETRLYMALLMGAAMAIVMLGFMFGMYKDKRLNVVILAVAAVVFAGALWLVRSQQTVGDVAYMKAMIPHHSIAIMTSERAHIKDPQVRRLADGVIDAQLREIAEMERHIDRLQAHPPAADAPDLPSYRARGAKPPAPETDESAGIDTTKIPR